LLPLRQERMILTPKLLWLQQESMILTQTWGLDTFLKATFELIVCREVQVPPGKLNVVIHSTNDGPAIYSVNEGSALANKVFPGDLITAVDSVDTRNLSAEQVLHLFVEKNDVERKMTVLHCE
jgi:hypothetical protein